MEDFMSIQKLKKGFTLIELMVVIVIIGILAAIAIPKLFGMSAKAKASEVAPAAGTWMKLLVAYSMEKNAYGSFARIGYIVPGQDAFAYTGTPTGNVDVGEGVAATWQAESKTKLNDCPIGSKWGISAKIGESAVASIGDSDIPYVDDPNWQNPGDNSKAPQIVDPKWTGDKDKCSTLTPSFAKVAAVSGP
jgi:type IV pilus assembly protein PilA